MPKPKDTELVEFVSDIRDPDSPFTARGPNAPAGALQGPGIDPGPLGHSSMEAG